MCGCNVVSQNTTWKSCLMHIAIYHVKIILQSMGGWSASYDDFLSTIGCSCSWTRLNLQKFMWWSYKQYATWNDNWELSNMHLHGFYYYDFKLIGEIGEMSAM
jgi:hypothetical protein